MKKERKVWAITLIALWWLAPNQTNAQQDSVRQLSEVVITATKFPKSLSETGKVLTIIDEDQIRRSTGNDITQLLNEQVGLVVNGANSNPGKDKSVYLQGAKNDYTIILLDGVPLNDPSGVSGGAYDLRLISLDQVERIEILKGSQSTLYGSDAIAGVINIITKSGGERPIELIGALGYGSYNTVRGNVGVRGSTKVLDYSLGYSHLNTDGISEAKDENVTGFDKDGAVQNSFQANLGFKPNSKLLLKPFFRYNQFEGKYDGGAFTDDVLNQYTGTLLNTGVHANYSLNKGSVHAQYSYDQTDRSFDGTYGKSEYRGKFNHTEVFMNYQMRKEIQLLAGITRQDLKMLDTASVEKNPSVVLTSPYVSLFSAFGNFSAEVGGRYTNHTKFGEALTYSINPSYRFQNGLKLFLNLSTGFKSPSLYQLYGQYGANPYLKPERSQSLEGGVQGVAVNTKMEWRAVVFSRSVKDVIIYAYPTNINLDQQDDKGIELESSLQVTSRLKISAFYAFVTGAVTTKINNQDTVFNNLIRRPKNTIGVNMGYQFSKQLFMSLNLKTFGQRDDLYFDLTTFTNQSAKLSAYALLDFHTDYKLKNQKVSFFVDIKNLLNQDYQEVYGYNTMGINVNGGINIRL
ncbi:MAG: TonB-dependent receptor [Cyclobacteriaceae bacterium]|nr:TonB-dependent receptor [Cyclobacteriaceae bacterium]